MGTTTEKLTYLQGTKDAIKNAIVAKGVEVPEGTTLRGYAEKVGEITTGPKEGYIKISGDSTNNPKAIYVNILGVIRNIEADEISEDHVYVGTLVMCSNSIQLGAIGTEGEIESVLTIYDKDGQTMHEIFKVNGKCEIIFYVS